ncbi:MAG: rhomboid family intramembrane serine protease [Bacteroidales bacterium]|jgi:membrane associated rhomboid family serine protease|nr:rhomboid family intramembrane serine protease [Bacteroidales bacterium]MDD3330071.1 rhomboid family intramembrane serine protease [Bacteroidales bacterium]MDD4044081.1 rhomboid family intramembrane serine protease [Bacteroidales bacterium]MDD4581516.1 rhomboid family intramembrane serine protease [Bacteroidales bacterium]
MSNTYHSLGRFSILPPIVKNLLIINILCFLATIVLKSTFSIDLYKLLGLHYFQSDIFSPYQFITYMFMHGSFEHLFFNMFALWMFGSTIENVWGSKRFIIFYLITGIGAALTHYLIIHLQLSTDIALLEASIQSPDIVTLQALIKNHQFHINQYSGDIWNQFLLFQENVHALQFAPSNVEAMEQINDFLNNYLNYYVSLPNVVGASGSIYGLLLAFGILFPNAMIYIYFLFPMKAKWFVIIFGVIELISGIFGSGDGVAHFAHLGGMIFGLLLILLWRKKSNSPYQQ